MQGPALPADRTGHQAQIPIKQPGGSVKRQRSREKAEVSPIQIRDHQLAAMVKNARNLHVFNQKSKSERQLPEHDCPDSNFASQDDLNVLDNSVEGLTENSGQKSRLRPPTKFSRVGMAESAEVQIQTVSKKNFTKHRHSTGHDRVHPQVVIVDKADKDSKTPRVVQLLQKKASQF